MALERFANTPTPAAPSTPWTTLNGAITSGALSLTVTSASAFPSLAQFRVLIDSEWLLITAGAGTTTWTVTRGVEGSTPTAHAHGASIFHVLTAAALLRNPRSMTTLGDMEYMAADLGPARLAAPSDGDYVTRWTSGVPSWIASGGGGGTPGGSSGQLQYNNAGAFGGTDRLTWSSPVLSVDRAWAEFEFLADPTTAPTATAVLIAGNIEVGQHAYVVIFFDAAGNQTTTSPESNAVTMDGTHKQVDLTSIPIGPSGTVGRYIMRRYLAVDPSYWWVATINDNVTTTLRDNVAYGSSGANPPFYMGPIGTVPFNYTGGGLRDGNGGSAVQVAPQGVLLPGTWYAKMSFPQQGPIIYSHDAAYGAPEAFLHYTQQQPQVLGPSFFLGVGCGNLTNTGDANFGIGYQALRALTTGDSNTAFGLSALAACTSGFENCAVGQSALVSVTTGFENVAIGASAGANITTGTKNIAIGKEAYGPTTGHKWVVLGEDAGAEGTSGDCNILIGVFAGTFNAGTGTFAVKAGSNNTLIGEHTGFSTDGDFSNTLVIGHQALVDASNKAVIGNASVTDVYFGSLSAAAAIHASGVTIAGAVAATQTYVNAQGFVTAHALLSATHTDTTAGTVARGDLVTGQGATPKWTRLVKGTANQVLAMDGTGTDIVWFTLAAGSGDVVGPSAAVDNAIVRFNGTTGKTIQDYTSGAPTISDTGQLLVANGGAAAPVYSSTSFPTTGFYFGSATSIRIAHNGSQTATIGSAGWEIISSGAQISLGTDANGVNIKRNGSNIIEVQGATSTNAQTVRIYGSFTDASNYVRGALIASATAIELAFQTAGTGADDGDVIITPAGTGRLKYGTHNAIGAEAITGYIELKDSAGNVRKLAVVS